MRFSIVSILAAASMSIAAPAPAATDAPAAGYGIEAFSWSIEVAPGQTEVLNGTIEEVVAQAVAINPEFSILSAASKRDVEARDLTKRYNLICGNFPAANKGRIQEGINYLKSLPSGERPTNGPGPGNCGRVSCSYGAAIWWCNDNTFSYSPGHWDTIAWSAQYLIDNCASGSSVVSGQRFENADNKWNTIVRGNNC
ncbi:hypothetical protein K458DRAFT_407257 [Lentithecium fluviatile CBS 122367]|uniref:Secreted protein n=1 Tax=Lentithecium fluviatile CBS 122367 TaxID=1168545 RepID=A0A6G1IQI3_9PLEO|nr:hypothetical protein K458DRAFT_407257 [Lentithecium fluviatile CBS 122367]